MYHQDHIVVMKQVKFTMTLEVLRAMTAPARGRVISRRVGDALCHKIPQWETEGSGEIIETLTELADDLRRRLDEEGVDRTMRADDQHPVVPKRSRRDATALAAIITFTIPFLDDLTLEERLLLLDEGIDWTRVSGDYAQRATLYWVRAGNYLVGGEIPEAVDAFGSGVRAARRSGERDLEITIRLDLTDQLEYQGHMKEWAEEMKHVEDLTETILDRRVRGVARAHVLRRRATSGIDTADILGKIGLLRQARFELYAVEDDPELAGIILFHLAGAYRALGQKERAIETLREMIDVLVDANLVIPLIGAWTHLGVLHLELDEIAEGRKAFHHAEKYGSTLPDSFTHMRYHVERQKLRLRLQAEEYAEGIAEAEELLVHLQDVPVAALETLMVLSKLREGSGDIEGAAEALRQGLDREDAPAERRQEQGLELARLLHRHNHSAKALDVLRSSIPPHLAVEGPSPVVAECYDLLADLEESEGELKEAMGHLRRAVAVRRELAEAERRELTRTKEEETESVLRAGEEEIGRKVRARTDQELAEVLTGLQRSYGTFTEVEKKIAEQLDWLEVEDKRQVILLLRNAVRTTPAEEAIEEVSREVDLHDHLADLDPDFFERLDTRWPTLTKSQRRLCGLIRAGLQTPEIAEAMSITVDSVRIKRKRLRKRMGLERGERLETVISEI